MDCVYPLYVQTYEAIADAMRRSDVAALRAAFRGGAFLDGPAALAVVAAQVDAANRLPMLSRTLVCRTLSGPPCSAECRDTAR